MQLKKFVSNSEAETIKIAKEILRICKRNCIQLLLLSGNLGSGKTVFVRGLAKALKIKRPVKSPSFVLIQEYPCRSKTLIHCDLYRLNKISDLENLGLSEYLDNPSNLVTIEWAERLAKNWKKSYPAITVKFKTGSTKNRRVLSVS
ncbi:MAG: tRNA (adenosine(37)-N6)-threonylcarbamoyltransferase complex ATPase subunit type 1 TsaE [Elusimicrobia bacterium]|nr:tRNA (adenosine(37)-N6)-threonylcarbamoyltransferase complex ATPase subunit type 1 TsaE [Elusimicrobiota bacterium]